MRVSEGQDLVPLAGGYVGYNVKGDFREREM